MLFSDDIKLKFYIMKKTLLFGFVLSMAIAVNAQHFGVQAGGSITKLNYKTSL